MSNFHKPACPGANTLTLVPRVSGAIKSALPMSTTGQHDIRQETVLTQVRHRSGKP